LVERTTQEYPHGLGTSEAGAGQLVPHVLGETVNAGEQSSGQARDELLVAELACWFGGGLGFAHR
jgi:hypothetical protein